MAAFLYAWRFDGYPESWVWARFGTAMINRDAERIPLSVNEREKLQKIYDYYGASGVIGKVDKYLFSKPLLLIGEDGANLLTRSKPIAFIAKGQYWVNNHAHVLDSSDGLLLEYVAVYINAINLAPYVTGTAQPKMNQEKMNSILIPIPPTGEQFRIVQKINQILSQIAITSWTRRGRQARSRMEPQALSGTEGAAAVRLRIQRPETIQTTPPGCGSRAFCGAVRSARQQRRGYPLRTTTVKKIHLSPCGIIWRILCRPLFWNCSLRSRIPRKGFWSSSISAILT